MWSIGLKKEHANNWVCDDDGIVGLLWKELISLIDTGILSGHTQTHQRVRFEKDIKRRCCEDEGRRYCVDAVTMLRRFGATMLRRCCEGAGQ